MVEVALDDLVSRQQVELVIRVTFPRDMVAATCGLTTRLADRDDTLRVDPARIDWEYADHAANNAQRRDASVDLAVAGRYAARAREDAAELNRGGELEKARGTLLATARRVREYAGRHPQMLQLVHELEQTADRHRVSFAAHEIKGERFAAYSRREGKDIMGRRVRV